MVDFGDERLVDEKESCEGGAEDYGGCDEGREGVRVFFEEGDAAESVGELFRGVCETALEILSVLEML